jgi:polyisoprenoid-binding protein YceI
MSKWILDPYHTQVGFSARHLGMMTVRGHFMEVTSEGDIDPEHPERSHVEVTVRTPSITTNHPRRDDDLRASNFLDIEHYPEMTFRSTGVDRLGGDKFSLRGDLTLNGTTKPITLTVTRLGEFNDPQMGHRIGYSAEGSINRHDFGMSFDAILDGRLVVSETVKIELEGELVEQPG